VGVGLVKDDPTARTLPPRPAREGVEAHEEPGAGLRGPAAWRAYAREIFTRRFLAYIGPGFLVSVGYMDPGNWGTDLEAGARFGYDLLWVLLASNIMAIILQALAAKLGLVTNRSLAENCREQLARPLALCLWVLAELAMMATDLAEFLGAALGFYILLQIPLPLAGLVTGVAVFLILALSRYGYRHVDYTVMGLVSVIGLCYLLEIVLARPDWGQVAYHSVVPSVGPRSIVVAVGMLGATVMPHNLFLHSGVIRSRALPGDEGHTGRLVRYATADAIFALTMAWLVNSAIVVVAAAAFHQKGITVTSITQAHQTLTPLLGHLSAVAFAVALLCSGLSSSVTGTMAGQIVIEGFLKVRFSIWLRRLITMIPAMVVILLGVNEIQVLVLSQVALSLQLPFAVVPLLLFTRDRRLMGQHVNRPAMNVAAWFIAAVIVFLNVLLLVTVLGGSF
jgi:manganese transport protein